MRIVSSPLETALAFNRMPASAPLKILIELLAVVADESGNQATLADDVCCRSSSAPSTV
jgi:hypothetical protein